MRTASVSRETKETKIDLMLNLDQNDACQIDSGVGFLDHMLTLFSVHSGFGLNVKCIGDTYVDFHHTVEDIGICLGQCFKTAIFDKKGICRYGVAEIPMDEALTKVTVDISGRPFLVFNGDPLNVGMIGKFDCQLVEEFMRAFAFNAGITLHINYFYGKNYHHIAESIFKGLARALRVAVKVDGIEIPSSKGML